MSHPDQPDKKSDDCQLPAVDSLTKNQDPAVLSDPKRMREDYFKDRKMEVTDRWRQRVSRILETNKTENRGETIRNRPRDYKELADDIGHMAGERPDTSTINRVMLGERDNSAVVPWICRVLGLPPPKIDSSTAIILADDVDEETRDRYQALIDVFHSLDGDQQQMLTDMIEAVRKR